MSRTILFGLIGTTLDLGFDQKRWERWRPSVAACQHEDLLIDEYHILHPRRSKRLANQIADDVAGVSPETTVILHEIDFRDWWDFQEVYAGLHDFLKPVEFSTEQNDYLFNITTGTHVAQICIFLLVESRHFPGKLLQLGLRKNHPPGTFAIIDLDLSKYDVLASRFAEQTRDDITFLKSGIDTRNRAFNELIEQIELVALRSSEPILLTGPTGAGKSHLARRIYELKKLRSQITGEFVEVNCATLRGDAAMSALFGHKRGAFTGAVSDRPGLLKTAHKGILFLDEVGELGLDEQAMLLQAIEEKRFMSVGADKETGSDFQLICGTNRDLRQHVSTGAFREDLLARINLWTFQLPGLRQRPEDIEPNVDYELQRYTEKSGQVVRFNKEARARFLKFATSLEAKWTANFRDLNGAIVRMCTLALGGRITIQVLDEEIGRLRQSWSRGELREESSARRLFNKIEWAEIDPFDKAQLDYVIQVCRNARSLSEAGRNLYSVSRTAKANPNDADRLRKYLARFGLTWQRLSEQ